MAYFIQTLAWRGRYMVESLDVSLNAEKIKYEARPSLVTRTQDKTS